MHFGEPLTPLQQLFRQAILWVMKISMIHQLISYRVGIPQRNDVSSLTRSRALMQKTTADKPIKKSQQRNRVLEDHPRCRDRNLTGT